MEAPPVRGPVPPSLKVVPSAAELSEPVELALPAEPAEPVLLAEEPESPPQPASRLTDRAPAKSMARYFFIFIYLLGIFQLGGPGAARGPERRKGNFRFAAHYMGGTHKCQSEKYTRREGKAKSVPARVRFAGQKPGRIGQKFPENRETSAVFPTIKHVEAERI